MLLAGVDGPHPAAGGAVLPHGVPLRHTVGGRRALARRAPRGTILASSLKWWRWMDELGTELVFLWI